MITMWHCHQVGYHGSHYHDPHKDIPEISWWTVKQLLLSDRAVYFCWGTSANLPNMEKLDRVGWR